MKEYLSQKGADFEEVDVTSNGEARKELMKERIMAVPVVKIKDEYVVGFDKEKLDKLM
ncbi:MAG: glutaredoxin family protein [Marinisporobacter sp.]|nr:glutaredoxin family protein [Marinisporobacter sp.]